MVIAMVCRRYVSLLCAIVVAGCGQSHGTKDAPDAGMGGSSSGSAGKTGASGGMGSTDKHPAWQLQEAVCDTYRACCETAGFFGFFEPCVVRAAKDAEQFRASIAAGRLSIGDDALAQCAEHVRVGYLGCDSQPMLRDRIANDLDCIDGVVGRVPLGDACGFREECAGASSGDVACVDGVCTTITAVAAGAACKLDDSCGASSYCGEGTCRLRMPVGARCTESRQCADLHCNMDTNTCAKLPDRTECGG